MSEQLPDRYDPEARAFHLRLGDQWFVVPEQPSSAWNARVAEIVIDHIAAMSETDEERIVLRAQQGIAEAGRYSDRVLELVLDYDRTGALPDRAWFRRHANKVQLHLAFQTLVGRALRS